MKVIHRCLVLSLLCVVGAGCSDLTWKSPDDLCGNGELDWGEQCDEGMNNGDDKWCTSQCEMNTGVHCNSERTECKPAGCGNGMIDDGEECDDGEGNNGDDKWCTSGCKINTEVHCANGHTDCKPIGCGDGVIAGDEECDNGTDNSDEAWCTTLCKINPDYHCDASRKNCVRIGCGNGVIDEGEECDDGEGNNGDDKWCNSDCKINTNVHCGSDHKNCSQFVCGDGVINGDEECDDGENNGNDKWCDSECKINTKVHCDSDHKNCRKPDCGDGVINGDEECDDGENNGDDKWCNSECKINSTVRCSEDHKKCTVIGCGDRIIEGDEECDNGTDNSDDAWCTSQCKLNPQYQCDASRNNCVRIGCGDEVVADEEVCDDGNQTDGDGCSSDCKKVEIENGYICPKNGGECIKIQCGDGKLNAALDDDDPEKSNPGNYVGAVEECDEGKENNGDDNWCRENCTINTDVYCDETHKNCTKILCGDGKKEGWEDCDEGNDNKDDYWCMLNCMINPAYRYDGQNWVKKKCGDGFVDLDIVELNEICDDGNNNTGDGCDGTCHLESGYVCPKEGGICIHPVCGNGILDGKADNYVGATEECDEGSNNSNANWCMGNCRINPLYREEGGNWVKRYCGDGFIDTLLGEACDDGNNGAGDGCDPLCNVEQFFECKEYNHTSLCRPICGDGVWLSDKILGKGKGEECDDGNKENEDGCSSKCTVEPDYKCIPRSFNSSDELKEYMGLDDANAEYLFNNVVENTIFVMATQRDFRKFDSQAEDAPGTATQTFIDGLEDDNCKNNGSRGFEKDHGHPDFTRLNHNSPKGIFNDYLDKNDKPILNENDDRQERVWTCKRSANMWFNDDPNFNKRFTQALGFHVWNGNDAYWFYLKDSDFSNILTFVDNDTRCGENYSKMELKSSYYNLIGTYYYKRYNLNERGGGYYPIIGKSLEYDSCSGNNSEFTTEIHAYVKYKSFDKNYYIESDDDSWMFVNHRLLLDDGGIHGPNEEKNMIRAEDVNVGKDNAKTVKYNKKYKMYENGIYPVSVFFMERGSGSTLNMGIPDLIDAQASICVKKN